MVDEKLIAQLTSRRKLYDSKGREKLESKADLRARGAESPDRADALIGTIVLGQESQIDWRELLAVQKEIKHRMQLDYLRTGRAVSWGVSVTRRLGLAGVENRRLRL